MNTVCLCTLCKILLHKTFHDLRMLPRMETAYLQSGKYISSSIPLMLSFMNYPFRDDDGSLFEKWTRNPDAGCFFSGTTSRELHARRSGVRREVKRFWSVFRPPWCEIRVGEAKDVIREDFRNIETSRCRLCRGSNINVLYISGWMLQRRIYTFRKYGHGVRHMPAGRSADSIKIVVRSELSVWPVRLTASLTFQSTWTRNVPDSALIWMKRTAWFENSAADPIHVMPDFLTDVPCRTLDMYFYCNESCLFYAF